jgi:hypothetical protein
MSPVVSLPCGTLCEWQLPDRRVVCNDARIPGSLAYVETGRALRYGARSVWIRWIRRCALFCTA